MREVEVGAIPLSRLAREIRPERVELLEATAERASLLLAGRTVWNVNSTAQSGGGAEMLQTVLDAMPDSADHPTFRIVTARDISAEARGSGNR